MKGKYEQSGVAVTCRGYEEYVRMFDLGESELSKGDILDVAAGASSFTADGRVRGLRTFAADPRYAKSPEALTGEAREEIAVSTAKLEGLKELFDYSYYGSLDNHRAMREASLGRFAEDYGRSDRGDRYFAASLPALPFEDGRFGLVLCSHFLFLYGEQFGYDFHRDAALELLRVCKPGGQVRIYPLSTLGFRRYPDLGRLMEHLSVLGYACGRTETRLPFIPGSSEILTIGCPE
ncbi:class I SAM-dependent methyltransferase [uncultured Paenibacillus sp.]|uniref:class I SAM-dependent methyltransferase n=1 Tax=uncultured Paenibacillus sp. TaxID=227322 RepID=UPI0028D037AB|nr:class I SAM-dependent methyltransferase [uncultured Paenibacillus sp.]